MNGHVDNPDSVTPGSEAHMGAALESLGSQLCLGCGRNLELSRILPRLLEVAALSTSQGGEDAESRWTHALAKLAPASSQPYSPSRASGFPRTRVGEAWEN